MAQVPISAAQLEGVETYLNPTTGAPEVSFYDVLNALTKNVLGGEVGNLSGNNSFGTGGLGEFKGELGAVLPSDEFEGFDDQCIAS